MKDPNYKDSTKRAVAFEGLIMELRNNDMFLNITTPDEIKTKLRSIRNTYQQELNTN